MDPVSPALLIIIPLLAALVVSGFAWLKRPMCFPVALAGLVGVFITSLEVLARVLSHGVVQYRLAGWSPPFGIEFRIDLLNGLVLAVVAGVGLFNLLASRDFVERDMQEKSGSFYAIYLLFFTGLIGVVVTADLFNLYVLLEVTSLTAYAQIAMGPSDRAPLASLNYVFIGVIGASFYLLGVGYIYIMTGSLNMVDVASLIPAIQASKAVLVAFVFCMVGVWIKMAFFPLHIWLPNAYTYAPLASSRLIAPLMTKVMVYVMIRLMISVFGLDFVFGYLDLSQYVIWLAILAIVAGGLLALAQNDLRRMLAYIIVSEIGYTVGGAWLGNQAGMTGAILHIFNDALMTFCLFLVLGNIVYAFKTMDMRFSNLQGLFAKMPLTMAGLVVAGLSIIGVPPTCGFFSKWYLLSGALQAGEYGFMAALILSSLINAILFFRVFEIGFFEPMGHGHHGHGHGGGAVITEAPVLMLITLGLVSLSLVVFGLYSGLIVDHIILPFVPQGLS